MSTKKKILLILGVELLVLVAIYTAVSIYYKFHFYVNTSLNGTDVSNCSANDVKEQWDSQVKGYVLDIVERDGSREQVKGSDINLTLQWDDSVEKLIRSQTGFDWLFRINKKNPIESATIVAYDDNKLQPIINGLNCMKAESQVDPVDATYSEYSEAEGITVVAEIPGTTIDMDAFQQMLSENINGLQKEYVIAEEGGYVQPKVTSESEKLNSIVEQMNEYAKSVTSYDLNGEINFTLDAGTFADWFVISEDGDVTIDEAKAAEYVKSLGKKYNTCYTAKKLNTSYGKTVTISNSHYGWKIDEAAETAKILEDIKAGNSETRDLIYSMTANSHLDNDYGNSYVEVNLTSQRLFLYKNGEKILESDFVSGSVIKNTATPPGAFGITYCERNATLNGENYSTKVSYWMPFNGNIGLHDASSWRSAFGGSIFRRNGSHGCVNLPTSSAKVIFENVEKNYPVLCYELPGTERGVWDDLDDDEDEDDKDSEEDDDNKKKDDKKKKSDKKKKKNN